MGVRASDGKLLWSYNRVANRVANIPTRRQLRFASTARRLRPTGYRDGGAEI